MKAEAFAKSIDELYERLRSLTATKGEEYKRREDNQFANFERIARELGLTREQVLLTYLAKHLNSITTYVRDRAAGQEKQYAEPISGRIDDAILYLLLLRGMTVENDRDYAQFIEAFGTRDEAAEAGRLIEERRGTHGSRAVYEAEGFKFPDPTAKIDLPGPPLPDAPTFIVSVDHGAAVALCREMGLQPAVAALSTVDQMHGVRAGCHIIFVESGRPGDAGMLGEVRERCVKQSLTHEIRPARITVPE